MNNTVKQAFTIILSMILGAGICFGVMLNLNGGHPTGDVSITSEEYEHLKYMDEKYGKVEELYDTIKDSYYKEISDEELNNGILKGLFAGTGDPYTEYMTAEEYESWTTSLSGEFEGVGVTYSEYEDGEGYIISVVHKNSPAEKAGLKVGDIMLKVDGKSYDNIVSFGAALRGEAGTEVKLTYARDGKEKTVTMIRAKITITTVTGKMLEDKIGYIQINAFESNTADEFVTVFNDLEKKGMKSFIIDLRDNGGGYVREAQRIADMLLGSCELYYTEDGKGKQQHYDSDADKVSIPYVLLVNENTASASEILSVAVQDNDGGKLVGTTTYGKGVIQYDTQLDDGSGYKITIMQYFSPKGNVIHGKGVKPDYEVKNKDDKTDSQLEKAIELLN